MNVEISNGELVDKVSILSIKLQRITDRAKLANVQHEHELLSACMRQAGITTGDAGFRELLEINGALWDIENRIRAKEAAGQFDHEFVALARSVYVQNDRRAAVKHRIDSETGSRLTEEKEYHPYG